MAENSQQLWRGWIGLHDRKQITFYGIDLSIKQRAQLLSKQKRITNAEEIEQAFQSLTD